ncbi:MAG: glycine oxidase ThiO [Proteobacteria bacterium]|nr:glycine oxidase ThiO [Pseudomonadota bacterium]
MKTIIVGAGVAGLAIGWKLAQAGVDVLILERAQPARAATWAAAGMIAPTAESAHANADETQFARWSAALWPDFAAQIETQSGRRVGYKRDGALIVAPTDEAAQELRARSNKALLTASEARAREPLLSASIAGALWDSDEAQVDNRALGVALANAFLRAGGKLSPNEAAVRIETEGSHHAVRTPFGLYAGDNILIAAGAWSAEIETGTPVLPPARPVKGEMLALTPPANTLLPRQVVWGNGVYLVPRESRLLIGATMRETGFDISVTKQAENWLLDRAIALMPALASWTLDEHWAGLRPGSPDGLPILGETRLKNLFVATGQFRNGILFAPAVAETVSRLILGSAAPEIRSFTPQRFAEVS